MYGKPAPKGSGNGWKGWYKNWFFRSLRELSYMINVIEKQKLFWENGEQNKYKVIYTDWDGVSRKYFPDFVINNNVIIEIKPKKLWESPKILAKKLAAEQHYKKLNFEYKIIDPEFLTKEQLVYLYNNKLIKFLSKYEQKFIQYVTKKDFVFNPLTKQILPV